MSREEAVMPMLMSNAGAEQNADQARDHAPEAKPDPYEWRGTWVVAAHGSYDMHSIQPLTDALNAAARKHPKVILDASGVDFADSTFLNLLILTHQTGTLRVAAPPEQLQRLLAITGADTVLEIRETLYDAAVS
ncbi:STAS domain-containing protein [Streptomyces sp. NPDC046759]|uniref:STAS domain-containing protein n=1 Tax=Streptomyces sp. NPDC046759 TaxID=3155019 RepID=UPI003407CB78